MIKILLVEDEPFLSSLLKSRFQKEGFEVYLSKDGEEAVNLLEAHPVDAILLDLILPKKSGFEVMAEIGTNPQIKSKNAPIIIISNLGQPEDVAKGKELGAVDYFIKAKISIDDLVSRIKSIIVPLPA